MQDTLRFLGKILPPQGPYCAARLLPGGGFHNIPRPDLISLADAVLTLSASGQDTYMALASFRRALEPTPHPRTGRPYFSRKGHNVAHLKSFWLDIDVGPDKAARGLGYASRPAARAALAAFCVACALPVPMLVSSGGGYHCYWPLTEALPASLWQPVARMLKSACQAHGLLADPACTADDSRVLRPVGTHNHKGPVPRPVRLELDADPVDTFSFASAIRAAFFPFAHSARPGPALRASPAIPAELAQAPAALLDSAPLPGLERPAPAVKPIVSGCRQVREAGTQSEPVWHKMISVVRLCQDGRQHIHALSAPDARYDPLSTDAKIDQAEQAQSGGMPASCAVFDALRPNVCPACAHWQQIRSPISLAYGMHAGEARVVASVQPSSASATAPPAPAPMSASAATPAQAPGWVRPAPSIPQEIREFAYEGTRFGSSEQGTFVWEEVVDADGNKQRRRALICPQRVFPLWNLWEADGSGARAVFRHFRIVQRSGDVNDITIPGEDFVDIALTKTLQKYGVNIENSKYAPLLGVYMRGYINAVEGRLPDILKYPHYGWQKDGKFIVGNRTYLTDGQEIMNPVDGRTTAYAERLGTLGSLDEWKRIAAVAFRPGMEHSLFALGLSFAAPLMRHAESRGFVTHYWGESGGGKSTTQKLVNSVWGHPSGLNVAQFGSRGGSTLNALMDRLGILANLPLCLDEITTMPAEDIAANLYLLSTGKGRDRMTASLTIRHGAEWATAVYSSANNSLREKISMVPGNDGEALAMRYFEIRVFKIPDQFAATDAQAMSNLELHHGVAGAVYARWLAANGKKLKFRFDEVKNVLRAQFQMANHERFWLDMLTAHAVALELANACGVLDIGPDTRARLDQWIGRMLQTQRADTREARVSSANMLGDFMADMVPNTLVVTQSQSSKSGEADTFVLMPPRGALHVRIERSTGDAYLSHTGVREWCRKKGIAVSKFKAHLRDQGHLRTRGVSNGENCKVSLGRGADSFSHVARQTCFRVNGAPFIGQVLDARDEDVEENESA